MSERLLCRWCFVCFSCAARAYNGGSVHRLLPSEDDVEPDTDSGSTKAKESTAAGTSSHKIAKEEMITAAF
jgi:hypothetical protein